MKTCYILRGVPGSGKTKWIQDNLTSPNPDRTCLVFSADDYHTDEQTGKYNYNPKNAREAHNWCRRNFFKTCEQSDYQKDDRYGVIAVSNTNIHVWELAPYVGIAEAFGYEVKIIRMLCDPLVAFKRNVHSVPLETVWRMHLAMENLPSIWIETPVKSD